MRLYLMRHGEAEHHAPGGDSERSLTRTGKHQARASADWLLLQGLEGTAVICSPYRRARQTAAVVAERLGADEAQTLALLEPDGDPRRVTAWLGQREDAALILVTHMPLVSQLAGWLEEGVLTDGPGFRVAQVLALEMEEVGAAQARRQAVYRPPD